MQTLNITEQLITIIITRYLILLARLRVGGRIHCALVGEHVVGGVRGVGRVGRQGGVIAVAVVRVGVRLGDGTRRQP